MVNKVWSIHTMEYYSALNYKEILTPATTWMKLEDITVSEISQNRKGHILYTSPNTQSLQQSNSQRQKAEWWLPGAGRRGR